MKYLLTGEQTERLSFRLLEKSDFETWQSLFDAPRVAEFLDMKPGLTKTQYNQAWFDKVFHRYTNELGGMNVLIDKSTHKLVGQCGLLIQDIEGEQRMEIGYAILPEYWGLGYASEAAKKCKEYAFANHFTDNLISAVHFENSGSEKVALKNGMVFEKKLEKFNVFSVFKLT